MLITQNDILVSHHNILVNQNGILANQNDIIVNGWGIDAIGCQGPVYTENSSARFGLGFDAIRSDPSSSPAGKD